MNFGRDVQGYNAFAPSFSTVAYSATLAASTPESLTVPTTNRNWIAVMTIEGGSDVWVANNHTAAVPAGGTFAATNSELIPLTKSMSVIGGDVLSFITSTTTADVSVVLYAVSQ